MRDPLTPESTAGSLKLPLVVLLGLFAFLLVLSSRGTDRSEDSRAEHLLAEARQHDLPSIVAETSVDEPRAAPAKAGRLAFPAGTTLELNDAREVLRVEGPNPNAVLLGYVLGSPHAFFLDPLDVQRAPRSPHQVWLGVFRDYRQPQETFAVEIHRDYASRRWVAGNGRGPVFVIHMAR